MKPTLRAALTALSIAGCGDNGLPPADGGAMDLASASSDMAQPPLGQPITAPKNAWTWIDFPDSACDDGSPTGIGVNLTDSKNVLIFFNGGGACWDAQTCLVLNTSSHGPFGATQFNTAVAGGAAGSILDRTLPGNPFADWNQVFVPYCTGDLHAGDNVAMYTANGMTVAFHHVGHANVLAYLKRLGATFTSVDQMVVSGSSAGGFGALFDYADFRRYWPTQNLSMLDDSGPPLEAGSFPDSFVMSWFQNWRLDKLTDPLCGQPCRDDLSKAVPLLIATFPNDRMALLSSLQDKTIRGFALLSATGFQTVLLQMAMDLLDPAPRFHYFFVPGETHTMLGNPNNFTQNGVPLLSWITQFATGDPAWASQKP